MRLAEKAGVVVESSTTMNALDRFYELLAATAERQTFIVRPRSYYRDLLEAFHRQGQVRIYLASREGETVAASVIVRYGARLTYLFSGSSDEGRRLKAPYLLQQRVIRDGQAAGAVSYDLWGIPLDPQPGDAGWGYAQFKAMLGGVPVRFVGAWDIPVQRPLAAAYHLAERVAGRRTMVA
jgi:lipid II:glycine glycyltransferase (peptidoglycan interpeptide bridge formation enzyme)